MNRIRQCLVAVALVLLGMSFAEAQERAGRVALVVGNAAYTGATPLANPTNDARDVAKLLAALDFEVVEAIDVDRRSFGGALAKFLDRASRAEAALLYYAGHGIQLDEDNYLLPVDAEADSVFALKADAFSLKGILSELDGVSPVNLVFLDACRNNPLAEKLSRSLATRSGGPQLGRGLTRVDPSGANTMIAFAAAPGAVALDGTGRNSPFTTAFLKNVGSSKEEVSTLFKAIVRDVLAATEGQQQPQLVSSMSVNFFFNDPVAITVAPPAPVDASQTAFDIAAKIDTVAGYKAVVDSFPGTIQAKLALAAQEKLLAAEKQREADKLAAAAATKIAADEAPAPVAPTAPAKPETQVAALSPEEIESGLALTPEVRRDIQAALTRLGYDAGGSDGVFGNRTRNAIRLYQVATAAPETGFISPDVLASLGVPFGGATAGPVGDARSYTLADLGANPDPRLAKVINALPATELRFGFFNGHLYVAVLAWSADWEKAKRLSEAAGGHLVTIGSKAEQDFVFNLFATDDRFVTADAKGEFLDGPWIGLFQAKGAREPAGGWQWVTGEPMNFKHWSPWAPDNHTVTENFGRFWGTTIKGPEKRAVWWDDGNGAAEFRGFIIEVEPLKEVAAVEPATKSDAATAPAGAALPAPGGEARKIVLADLPADVDPRLRKAAGALSRYEVAYGTFRGKLYLAVLTWGLNWEEARAAAERAGGHLVTITDRQENDFVYNLFASDERFIDVGEDGMDKNGPWIGLFQPPGSKEPKGGWRWVTDEPFKYANWTRHQPNNYQGDSHVGLFYSYGTREPGEEQSVIRWDDAQGQHGKRGFIMEIEPLSGAVKAG